MYGNTVWKFIPRNWRQWWLPSVSNILAYENVTIDTPSPLFVNKSYDMWEFKNEVDSGDIIRLNNTINKHLYPTFLCPWGCTGYIHKAGVFRFDLCIQRFLRKCVIKTMSNVDSLSLIQSCRDDYIRHDISEYDCLLLNDDDWKVLPSLFIHKELGAVILTCPKHNNGTHRHYIHPPRTPKHNLSAPYSDQLCQCVIKTRTIQQMRASKYCVIYHTVEQKGSFQGVDTADVTNFGDFNLSSVFLDESESRSIAYRMDINSYLGSLGKQGKVSETTVKGLRERARASAPSPDVIAKHIHGSTYVSMQDSM